MSAEKPQCSSACEAGIPHRHEHKGRSSESMLDKSAILGALNIRPGQIILDAGCGNGYMSKEFSKLTGSGGRVYAIDPDGDSIAALSAEATGSNLLPILGDMAAETPIEDKSIDIMYMSLVFHGFTESQIGGFRKEALRILRPDGILAIVEIHKKETPFGPPMQIRVSPEELLSIMGMRCIRKIDFGDYFYLLVMAPE